MFIETCVHYGFLFKYNFRIYLIYKFVNISLSFKFLYSQSTPNPHLKFTDSRTKWVLQFRTNWEITLVLPKVKKIK